MRRQRRALQPLRARTSRRWCPPRTPRSWSSIRSRLQGARRRVRVSFWREPRVAAPRRDHRSGATAADTRSVGEGCSASARRREARKQARREGRACAPCACRAHARSSSATPAACSLRSSGAAPRRGAATTTPERRPGTATSWRAAAAVSALAGVTARVPRLRRRRVPHGARARVAVQHGGLLLRRAAAAKRRGCAPAPCNAQRLVVPPWSGACFLRCVMTWHLMRRPRDQRAAPGSRKAAARVAPNRHVRAPRGSMTHSAPRRPLPWTGRPATPGRTGTARRIAGSALPALLMAGLRLAPVSQALAVRRQRAAHALRRRLRAFAAAARLGRAMAPQATDNAAAGCADCRAPALLRSRRDATRQAYGAACRRNQRGPRRRRSCKRGA
jgi:hypothetical protein